MSKNIIDKKILVYSLLIILVCILGGFSEENIFGKNFDDSYFKKEFDIPIIIPYGVGALFLILLYEFGFHSNSQNIIRNLLILSLIATIIMTIGECIVGNILEKYQIDRWNYHLWNNSCYMIPFCRGYNSVLTTFLIFWACLAFLTLLYYINRFLK